MRCLVAIANHGTKNRKYLDHLLETYRGFSFDVDFVVLSDKPKDLGPDVEVKVGAPIANPWSLPFGHREIFVERQDDYDLFIYSEDDTEITEDHVTEYLRATDELPEGFIAGFLRYEIAPDGTKYCSTIHGSYHWDPASIIEVNGRVWAHYTNDHSASYILTRSQLKTCIASGGFDVPPHEGRYDMLCSAATDPYVSCGLRKIVCVSDIDRYSLRHLPDIYLGRIGVEWGELEVQVARMEALAGSEEVRGPICRTRSDLPTIMLDRRYYSPVRPEAVRVAQDRVPSGARILSVGCDIGETESAIADLGHDVIAIPVDAIVGASAEARGLRVVEPDLERARQSLDDGAFDVILFNTILSFLPDPQGAIRSFLSHLTPSGHVMLAYDNTGSFAFRRRLKQRGVDASELAAEAEKGLHLTTDRIVKSWLREAGLRADHVEFRVPERHEKRVASTLGMARAQLADAGVVLAARG